MTTGPGSAERAGRLLAVRDLRVSFPSEAGRVDAVRGLSYAVRPNEVLGIVGESGSGKSVSSLAVMGLLPGNARVSGSIAFQGTELIGRSDAELSKIRGRRISMIFQDPLSALTPVHTVGAQISEALLVHASGGIGKGTAARRAVELLDLVGIPNAAARAKSFPHEFSGGMRQRVMIAMAIANDPDLIIADEPTTALDVTVQAQVIDVLRTARDVTNAGIVFITHDLGLLAGFADRLLVMYAGRAVETGEVAEIYSRPRMPYTLGLLGSVPRLDTSGPRPLVPIDGQPPSLVDLPPGCPFAPRCPLAVDRCRTGEPPLIETLPGDDGSGHLAACIRTDAIADAQRRGGDRVADLAAEVYRTPAARTRAPAGPRAERAVVLEVDSLVKQFPVTRGTVFRRRIGTVRAVDGISFDMVRGETLALVGESGCGKTTVLTQILELAEPAAGSISVLGRDARGLDRRTRKEVRRDLQVVFQDPMGSLDPRMPVRDILAEPLRAHGHGRGRIERRVPELLDLVGLRLDFAPRYPSELSGGERQRIGIARALALEPRLIVLDEPVSALDVSIQAGVINLLDRLKAELDLSYLFVAHDLAVVRYIADRVAVMYLGKIVEIGTVRDVFGTPEHPYTRALLSAVGVPEPVTERRRERIVLTGELPSPSDPPSGCRFRTRCFTFAALPAEWQHRCVEQEPQRVPHRPDHQVACHYAEIGQVPGKEGSQG